MRFLAVAKSRKAVGKPVRHDKPSWQRARLGAAEVSIRDLHGRSAYKPQGPTTGVHRAPRLAFFSLHALAMDPAGHQFRREYLSGRTLLIDSNVLIPLLPDHGTFADDLSKLVQMARAAGMPVATTHGFIEEVFMHGQWAARLVEQNGDTSVQVLEAARVRRVQAKYFPRWIRPLQRRRRSSVSLTTCGDV